ncbi:hypothetical protein OsI_37546 [Oryza sativa Indica Group]|uniref:Late embryogenesis abundant protein LEA-2 subgroup domain-containing protein n=1 Tax=Oryza sativa subsp. indica TaxID=39946 RepID=A2ZIA3_ORYSI|nr:hypothetical protein OsI_37546 [Oryza sativa Indica Group]
MAMARAGGGGTCCSCLCAFLVCIGVAVLIYWATYQPHRIRAAVESAELSNLTVVVRNGTADGGGSGGVVYYRLAVNVTMYNPSGRAGPRMSTTVVAIDFDRSGGGGVAVAGDVAAELDKEIKGSGGGGEVGFEMVIDARVRYKLGFIPIRARPKVRCPVRIPVKAERRGGGGGGGGVTGFLRSGDRCTVKY